MPSETAAAVPDTLITHYLEMNAPEQARLTFAPPSDRLALMPLQRPDVRYYTFLYSAVGETWRWRDRLLMPTDELLALISRPTVGIHVLYADGAPAGYFELYRDGRDTEIDYLGLRPEFTGQGLGRHLLSCAIRQAWADGAGRVWLHTCNLDAPAALENYQKRGFVIYDTVSTPMPDRYR